MFFVRFQSTERQNFCVNVLKDDQAHIADTFAGRLITEASDKFACATWSVQATGAPKFINSLATFDCSLLSQQFIGTHYVFVGSVESSTIAESGSPLIYTKRDYVKVRDIDKRATHLQPKVNVHPNQDSTPKTMEKFHGLDSSGRPYNLSRVE